MAEGLTPRDYAILEAAFLPAELGKKSGHTYVKRSAIMQRLRLVDPGYETRVDTAAVQIIGDVVTVCGSLTLKGITQHNTCSKNVECWRKKDPNDASKGYVRVDEYEYARELANAIMKAATGLLHRCAASFGVGVYLVEKRDAPSLASVLNPQPDHWALNGGGERVNARIKALGLNVSSVLLTLEPGKSLNRLSQTTLTEDQVMARLDELAKKDKPADGAHL